MCYNVHKGKIMYASDLVCDRHKWKWKDKPPSEYRGECLHCDQRISRVERGKIQVGDLVKLRPWCKNKNRLAHVVDVMWFDTRTVVIQYLDTQGLAEAPCRAVIDNLEVINEDR